MEATIYLALLTHQTGMGTAGLPAGSAALNGRPLHLSLHATREAADAAVLAALRAEWDREHPYRGIAYALGASGDWKPELLLAEAERQGYAATVSEEPVSLDGPAA